MRACIESTITAQEEHKSERIWGLPKEAMFSHKIVKLSSGDVKRSWGCVWWRSAIREKRGIVQGPAIFGDQLLCQVIDTLKSTLELLSLRL